MSDYELAEDYESFETDLEFDEELEALLEDDEARKPQRRRPVRTGRGTNYYKPRPSTQYVTQAQLQSALSKISADVKANAAGIKSVGARVDTVRSDQAKLTALVKKDNDARRKELAKLKSGIQMSSLLPLLTSKQITIARETDIGGTTVPAGTKLSVAPDGISALLPMLLLGDGLGGSGGDSSNGLFLALALSGGL